MKKLFSMLVLPALMPALVLLGLMPALPIGAQNTSVQGGFGAQEWLAKPSLMLNFNDLTSSFTEKVSGLNFGGGSYSYGYFDGSTNYVHAASGLSSNSTFSYAGWVNITNASDSGAFFSDAANNNLGGTGVWVGVGSINGMPGAGNYLNVLCGGVAWQNTRATVGLGWHFIVVTRDGTTMKAYIDNVQTPTLLNATAVPSTPTGGVWMGQTNTGANLFPFFNGGLRQWSLYNGVLTSAQMATLMSGGAVATGNVGAWALNEGTGSMALDSSGLGNNGTWTGNQIGGSYYTGKSATVAVRQPGFDLTQPGNTSAGFPYNGYNMAPNNALGAIEWNAPWSMLIHIDMLNWNRTGTLVLASKGDSASNSNSWWRLALTMDGTYGSDAKLCFTRNSPGAAATSGAGGGTQGGLCTHGAFDAMPNGIGYDIVITDSGTGASGYQVIPTPLSLSINGLYPGYLPAVSFSSTYGIGFGYAVVNVSGGTGYAASTAFTSSGGGGSCTVAGTFASASGVPTTNGISFTQNNGCTSAPTIVPTTPTGTGAVFTTGTSGTSMNATGLPLMVPGGVSGGAYNGIDQADSTQTSTYVDEFAIFPGVLNQTAIQGLFSQTKFYQTVLGAVPAVRRNMIIDEDGCGDIDDAMAVGMVVKYHLLGYGKLLGIVSETGGTDAAMYRQMLDQAGLNQVPVSVSSGASGVGACSAANITAYNASTPQTVGAYPSAASMYRKIFAANPTTPVYVMLGGPFTGMSDFMKSAADGISSLTGLQLFAQNTGNGAYMVAQGLQCAATSPPNTVPCASSIGGDNSMNDYLAGQEVVNNNGTEPIYWTGGIPSNTGPGMSVTRTSKDPIYLEAITNGGDSRHCFDCMAAAELMTNYFLGGVELGVAGGTGYAATTPFTSTGGGAGCSVTGYMVSSGGVPASFNYNWQQPVVASNSIGSQCLSAPTIVLTAPAGTGAVITAYPTSVCGTFTITSATAGNTSSTTCGHHYFQPFAQNVPGAATTFSGNYFGWFTNSLLDPAPGGAPREQ